MLLDYCQSIKITDLLYFTGNMFIDGLQTIGKMVKQAPSDLREIALHTTANLIHIPVSIMEKI